MPDRRILATFSVIGLVATSSVHGQSIHWLDPIDGNWSDATKWGGGNLPNAAGESAVLGGIGPHTVFQNLTGLTLDAITIQSPDATLRMLESITLLGDGLVNHGVLSSSGSVRLTGFLHNTPEGIVNIYSTLKLPRDVVNNGTIIINPSGGSNTHTLAFEGKVTIGGSGEVVLNDRDNGAQITSTGSISIGSEQTIRGFGQISAVTVNNGLIQADVPGERLHLMGSDKRNYGIIRAVNDGRITITESAIEQFDDGRIEALDGQVILNWGAIRGGVIQSSGTGHFLFDWNDFEIDGVRSTAVVRINARMLITPGGFQNDGVVLVNPQGNTPGSIYASGDVTIDGAGEIMLTQGSTSAKIGRYDTTSTLTIGSQQVVRGAGMVTIPLTNQGLFEADVSGKSILFGIHPVKNESSIVSRNNGILELYKTTVTQVGEGRLLADGGVVTIERSTVSGGRIESSGTGVVRSLGTEASFAGLTSSARVEIGNAVTFGLAGSSFTNDGTLIVNSTAGTSTTTVRIDGPLTIGGTGEVILNAPGTRARLIAGVDGALTIGPQQTLKGTGLVALNTTLEGTLAPGASATATLPIEQPTNVMTYKPGSTLQMQIGSASSYDRITGGTHSIEGGSVALSLVGGYVPAPFAQHTIIDGAPGTTLTGRFDSVTGPALPTPYRWQLVYTSEDVIATALCTADYNASFEVDILDFLDFFEDFGGCENQPAPCGTFYNADVNGDTFVDILDFLDFLDAFGQGC